MARQSWDDFFFEAARLISHRSTCLRRQYGCVLVRDKTIITTGFNGAPRGCLHCEEVGCPRKDMASGERPDLCRAIHAEQNCIANAARLGISTIGSELYIYPEDMPCPICTKILINAGVIAIHYKYTNYPGWEQSRLLFRDARVKVICHEAIT